MVFDPTCPINWERFNSYASFVKHLTIQSCQYHYAESTITTVALWRNPFSVLPNLEELIVHCGVGTGTFSYQIDFATLFLSANLKHLQITFDKLDDIDRLTSVRKSGTRAFEDFLGVIPKCSPDIRSISLWAGHKEARHCTVSLGNQHVTWASQCLLELVSSLHKLETITICPRLMQPLLLKALSNLQDMKRMEVYCDQHFWVPYDILQYEFENPFVSLAELSLSSSFHTASSFISTLPSPSFRCLNVKAQEIEPAADLQGLISTIGQNVPFLRDLSLRSQLFMKDEVEWTSLIIDLKSFQGLRRLTQLRTLSFTVDWECEFLFSRSDFESLIRHWPLLEELYLPTSGAMKPKPTPHVLVLLAQHCPCLRRLSIEVDWASIDVYIDGDIFATPDIERHKFMKLESADFGTSVIEEHQSSAIAILLVDLSIPISAIQLPTPVTDDEDREAVVKELIDMWKDIKKLMTIAAYYRRRMKRLQDRVEVLEARSSESISSNSHSTSPFLEYI